MYPSYDDPPPRKHQCFTTIVWMVPCLFLGFYGCGSVQSARTYSNMYAKVMGQKIIALKVCVIFWLLIDAGKIENRKTLFFPAVCTLICTLN